MVSRLVVTALLLVVAAFLSLYVVLFPMRVHAVGSAADAMCSEPGMCQYGTKCGEGGPPGVLGKPCSDLTSGFTTSGVCIAPQKCQAQSTSDGAGPDAGLKQLLDALSQLMQQLKGGGGGGSEPSPFLDPCATSGNSSTTSGSAGCPGNSSSFFTPNSSIFDFTGGNTLGDLLGSGGTSGETGGVISSLLDGKLNATTASTSTSAAGSIVPGAPTTAPVPQVFFGSANGISGDIRLQGTSATLLASNRDTSRNTQISGMYGFGVAPGITAVTIFKSMCGLHPWTNNFLSVIIPTSYFDSLCSARGYALNAKVIGTTATTPAKTAPSTPVATTTAAKPAPPPPPAYLGPMSADIWASPPTVSLGSRTSIFWQAKGVLTCSLKSSDGNFTGSSLSGHASTLPITKNTTFSIACASATSSVINQVVVNVQ